MTNASAACAAAGAVASQGGFVSPQGGGAPRVAATPSPPMAGGFVAPH